MCLKADLGKAVEANSSVGKQRSPSYFWRKFQRQENKSRMEFNAQQDAVKASSFEGELITDAMKADDDINENKIEDVSTCVESNEKVTEGIEVPIIENGTTPLNAELQKVLTFRVANLPDIEGWLCKLSGLILDF